MNFLRQTPIPEQMHSFIKDKNAWENAISMYQGPDPLDNWYNYIQWYENQRQGCTNPENQFRQILERCLSIFEHTDFYKQDLRMVRLWLKYIDMQPNPLHFYQVLHSRGVGKQVAAFYISWANYYESVNSLREAEAVYNIAFKEKAQSYAELHHAHSKFLYAHSSALAVTPTVAPVQQQAYKANQQPQQQHQLPQSQPQPPQYNQQTHHQITQEIPHQTYVQVNVQRHPIQQYEHIHQSTNSINPQMATQLGDYPQQTVYIQQPAHADHQQHMQQPQQIQNNVIQQQPVYQQTPAAVAIYSTISAQIAHQPIQHFQQEPLQQPQQRVGGQQTTYLQHQLTQPQFSVPVEQQLPATSAHIVSQNQMRAQASFQSQQEQRQKPDQELQPTTRQESEMIVATENKSIQPQPFEMIPGIKLPKKFTTFSRNNYETWKPALFLEEPPDPCRQCNYKKRLVYPEDEETEYSPEELLARNYLNQLEKDKNAAIMQSAQLKDWSAMKVIEHNKQLEHTEERVFQQISSYNAVEQGDFVQNSNFYEVEPQNGINNADNENDDSVEEQDNGEDYEEDGDERDEDESDDDEDEDYLDEREEVQHVQQQTSVVNTIDDLEDQIEASTIRFSMHSDQQGIQNKTIRIKFKKEPAQTSSSNKNKTLNGNYSAYTVVQSIYQQKPQQQQQNHTVTTNHMNSPEVRRNGHSHSFHPYMIGQTSTPKNTTAGYQRNHHRSKLKKVSQFPIATGSSSNSSSAENGNVTNGNGFPLYANININPRNIDSSLHNATFNDNANYSFSSAAALDNSNCSLTSAVDRLNFRDSTIGGLGGATSKLNSTNVAEFSTYQENSYFATQHDTEAKELRLQKALTTIATHFEKEAIDPFNSELCRAFLTKLDFPNSMIIAGKNSEGTTTNNLRIVQTPLPKLANTRVLSLPEAGGLHYNIDKEVGRGSYGSVYKATDANSGNVVALKYQKPPNTWEIYICDQVLKRIKSINILPGLMDISSAIIAPNASLIATEFSPFGSLLDINNKIRQATTKVMHESLVMHFSAQICNIINHLHEQKIIHADIKPDNFLLMRVPSTDLHFPSLRLIDFGCAIDMTLFPDPDSTKFRKVIQTDGFTCIEMQEGRSWSYETDIFCIAGTVHVMLLGEYMQLQKRVGAWDIKQKLPRYLKKHVWNKFFGEILNIKNGKLPDLHDYHEIFDEEARKMDNELQKQIRTLSNILYRR